MKKFFSLILFALLMALHCQIASAYVETSVPQEGQTVADVTSLAVGAPQYVAQEGIPSRDEYIRILNEAGFKVVKSKYNIIPYDVVAKGILQKTGKDIYTLDRIPALKVYKDNVMDYADAYMISTVTMSRRKMFFFEVYSAATNELLYTYELITDSDDADDVKTYTEMVEKFYRNFGDTIESQKKEREIKAKAERKEREKAERREKRERKNK